MRRHVVTQLMGHIQCCFGSGFLNPRVRTVERHRHKLTSAISFCEACVDIEVIFGAFERPPPLTIETAKGVLCSQNGFGLVSYAIKNRTFRSPIREEGIYTIQGGAVFETV